MSLQLWSILAVKILIEKTLSWIKHFEKQLRNPQNVQWLSIVVSQLPLWFVFVWLYYDGIELLNGHVALYDHYRIYKEYLPTSKSIDDLVQIDDHFCRDPNSPESRLSRHHSQLGDSNSVLILSITLVACYLGCLVWQLNLTNEYHKLDSNIINNQYISTSHRNAKTETKTGIILKIIEGDSSAFPIWHQYRHIIFCVTYFSPILHWIVFKWLAPVNTFAFIVGLMILLVPVVILQFINMLVWCLYHKTMSAHLHKCCCVDMILTHSQKKLKSIDSDCAKLISLQQLQEYHVLRDNPPHLVQFIIFSINVLIFYPLSLLEQNLVKQWFY